MRGLLAFVCLSLPLHGLSAANVVSAPQGGVARWADADAMSCGVYGKRYAAVDGVCYYPVDIKTPPGAHEIALWDSKERRLLGTLEVLEVDFPEVAIELPAKLSRFLEVSKEDAARASRETAEVAKLIRGSASPPRFSLPLQKPAKTLPRSENDFGSRRMFNAKLPSRHSGRDFPVGKGNNVRAPADGTVLLAVDHFYTGNAVYVDHGNGLVSMAFHLDKLKVKAGDEVKRGQPLGTVGATGRATGPHLHLGLRWLGQRIDPMPLFDPPARLPSVSDTSAEAEAKIRRAQATEPRETDPESDEG